MSSISTGATTMLPVVFRLLDDSEFHLDISESFTVNDALNILEEEKNISQDDISLMYEGEVLKESQRLIDFGLVGGDEICIIPSKRKIAIGILEAAGAPLNGFGYLNEAEDGSGDLIQAYIDSGIPYNFSCGGAMKNAMRSQNIRTVTKLITYFEASELSLEAAVETNNAEIVKLFLQKPGIDLGRDDPLFTACNLQNKVIAELLISSGMEATCGALQECIRRNNHSLTYLVATDTNISEPEVMFEETSVFVASQLSDPTILKYLLNRGVSPNVFNAFCETPLHKAVVAGRLESVQILINVGAAINTLTLKKVSPLMKAAELNRRQIFTLLKESGADVPAQLLSYK